jgi:hypothetical protein
VETKQQTETTGNYLITGGLMNGVQAVLSKILAEENGVNKIVLC